MDTSKHQVNLDLEKLFNTDTLTFLVGAGCSVDLPSCLPAGPEMIKVIIRFSCDESEIEKILEYILQRCRSLLTGLTIQSLQ